MVFHKLEQAVLPFEYYVDKNYKTIRRDEPGDGAFLTRQQRKHLFGGKVYDTLAFVFSQNNLIKGAPLASLPCHDSFWYTHPEKINDFDFTRGIQVDGQLEFPSCSFQAHI